MSQDRTQDRTRYAGADMREGGMPQGQAPARQTPNQRQMTAVEKAKEEARAFRGKLLEVVADQRPMIEGFLRVHGVDWEFFVAALKVGLEGTMKNDRDFFDPNQGVTVASFIDAVVRCAKDGLMPDGKQAAIARFKRVATYMPMAEGFCHILYSTGFVKDINHDVVRDCDEIDAVTGDDGYVRHKKPFKRPAQAETIGAWCVINLRTGGKIIELCDDKDLADIAGVSKATKGPRIDWEDEMHRKGPFRRAIKRAPKNPRLAQLIAHDDMNYDLSKGQTTIERTVVVPKDALFADKAAVKSKPKELAHEPAEVVETIAEEAEPAEPVELDAGEIVTQIRHAENLPDLAAIKAHVGEHAEQFDEEALDWIDEAIDARVRELTETAHGGSQQPEEDPDAGRLLAVIQSDRGPREYEDAREWRDDLLNKLSSLSGGAAKSFAKLNIGFVRSSMEWHPEEAGRVLKVFQDRNLIAKEED